LLLVGALVLVISIRLALWFLPFRTVRKLARRFAATRSLHDSPSASSLEKRIAAVQLAARFVPAATCLTQAIAAQILLARAGHTPALRIGVLTKSGHFKAHAWVECQGRIVIGEVAGLSDFKMLPAI
jgi:hypothetical protein